MLIATDRHRPSTRFPKSVKQVNQSSSLLKSVSANAKIGGHVSKGHWRGMPIVSLTLEERATCYPVSYTHLTLPTNREV